MPYDRSESQEERRRRSDYPGIRWRDILLPPNLLSLSRLLFAIPAVILIVGGSGPKEDAWAAALLALSFVSDVLDGIVARTFHFISDLGKVLDPVIDKFVVIATALALAISSREPAFPYYLVAAIVLRDVVILVLATHALKEDHHLFVSSWTGKATTFVIVTTLLAFIVHSMVPDEVLSVLPWISLAMLALSSVDYFEMYWSVKHKRYPRPEDKKD